MIKTYDIDLDDTLVDGASKIFENLGTDIDSAIKIFLTQAILRKGFPFDVTIPEKVESEAAVGGMISAESGACAETVDSVAESEDSSIEDDVSEDDVFHGGISEEEEFAAATATAESVATEAPVPQVSAEIAARVAANEALVAEMRNEIGEKEVTPEFDENEDDGTYGNYEQAGEVESEDAPVVTETSGDEEVVDVGEPAPSEEDDSEDEDETTPDNLFDAWDVGDEEEIGCK